MRLSEGMPLSHYQALAQAPLNAAHLDTLEREGLLTTADAILKVTDEGRPVIDALARYLQS